MARYINFFIEKYQTELPNQKIISLGCGTGLVEEYLMAYHNVSYSHIYGIDISESMVNVARKRLRADVGDITTLDPSIQMWDIAYSGLNVFLYLPFEKLELAIQKTAAVIKPGGCFLGDFITPDHIRWYPNTMYSKDKKVISLRTPKLVEAEGRIFQESEITNINFLNEEMEVSYAGKHLRFLPPLHRVRTYFEKAFGGPVDLYDAYSLKSIPDWADSCASTRYIVVAKKK
jgi:SAM-dependent methyltransferase